MKKHYLKPQMDVIKVKMADIIATSTRSAVEDYQNGSTDGWFNN